MGKQSGKIKQEIFVDTPEYKKSKLYKNLGIDHFAKGQIINTMLISLQKYYNENLDKKEEVLKYLKTIGFKDVKIPLDSFFEKNIVHFESVLELKEALRVYNFNRKEDVEAREKLKKLYQLSKKFLSIHYLGSEVNLDNPVVDFQDFLNNLDSLLTTEEIDEDLKLEIDENLEEEIDSGNIIITIYSKESLKEPVLQPLYNGYDEYKYLDIKDIFNGFKYDLETDVVSVLENPDPKLKGFYDPFFTLNSNSPFITIDAKREVFGDNLNKEKVQTELKPFELEDNNHRFYQESVLDDNRSIKMILDTMNRAVIDISTFDKFLPLLTSSDKNSTINEEFKNPIFTNIKSSYLELSRNLYSIIGTNLPDMKDSTIGMEVFLELLNKNMNLLNITSNLKILIDDNKNNLKSVRNDIKDNLNELLSKILQKAPTILSNPNDPNSQRIEKPNIVYLKNFIDNLDDNLDFDKLNELFKKFDLNEILSNYAINLREKNDEIVHRFKSYDISTKLVMTKTEGERSVNIKSGSDELVWRVFEQETKQENVLFLIGEPGTGKTEEITGIQALLGGSNLVEPEGDPDIAVKSLFKQGRTNIGEDKFQEGFSYIASVILQGNQYNRVLIDELIPRIANAMSDYNYDTTEIMNILYSVNTENAVVQIYNPSNVENPYQNISLYNIFKSMIFTGNENLPEIKAQVSQRVFFAYYTKKEEFTSHNKLGEILSNIIANEALSNVLNYKGGSEQLNNLFTIMYENVESFKEIFPKVSELKEKLDVETFDTLFEYIKTYNKEINLTNENGKLLTQNFSKILLEAGVPYKEINDIWEEMLLMVKIEENIELSNKRKDFKEKYPEQLSKFDQIENLNTVLNFLEIKGEDRKKYINNNIILVKGYNFSDLSSVATFILEEIKKSPELQTLNKQKLFLNLDDRDDKNIGKISLLFLPRFAKKDFNIYSFNEGMAAKKIQKAQEKLLKQNFEGKVRLRKKEGEITPKEIASNTKSIKRLFSSYNKYTHDLSVSRNGYIKLLPLLEQAKLDGKYISLPQKILESNISVLLKKDIEEIESIIDSEAMSKTFSNSTQDALLRNSRREIPKEPEAEIETKKTTSLLNYQTKKIDGENIDFYFPSAFPFNGQGNLNNPVYRTYELIEFLAHSIAEINKTIYPEEDTYENVNPLTYRQIIKVLGKISVQMEETNGFDLQSIISDLRLEEGLKEEHIEIINGFIEDYKESLSTIMTSKKIEEDLGRDFR